ncbi:MAG: 23S rRNA pseudouridine(1911/1915/1917) synthase RluD [Arenicellales bacterium]
MASITKQSEHEIQLIFTDDDANKRLDKALSDVLPDVSRATIQQWIKKGLVLVDGINRKPRDSVSANQSVEIAVPEVEVLNVEAEIMSLDIVYEDETLLVMNKPAGLVVHPGTGNWKGTLLNGLLAHHAPLERIARGGIVHRLDKDTSGLMVVAKTEKARQNLVKQLSDRTVKREYQAVIYGTLVAGGTVNAAIGRHSRDRLKMAVRGDGKTAITHYRIGEKYRTTTLLDVSLETGRTHQIRVHMFYKKLPLVGDPIYGKRLHFPMRASEDLKEVMAGFKRQALHARKLGLIHPETSEPVSWELAMPDDMARLCAALKKDARENMST